MTKHTSTLFGLAAIALFALDVDAAHAQATRTWVSGVGDDVNPCSRTAPCKTFAGAISKTAANGEINCIDPGGFGTVTITKSITIDCAGTLGSILNAGVTGVIVNTGATNVTLRNLSINGAGTGSIGVRVLTNANVLIENVQIFNQATSGIHVDSATAGTIKLDIKDTTVHTITNGGILLKPAGASTFVTASLTRVSMHNSLYGLRVEDRSRATVFQSVASNNSGNGYLAVATSAAADITLVNSVAANTTTNGVATSGALATVRMVNSASVANGTGLAIVGGTIAGTTPDTNINVGNGTDNAPNQNVALN